MSKTTQKSISYAGTFERSMDAKNRVTIPAAWLNGGPDEFHAIPEPSGDCLIVMPPEEFDSIESRIEQCGAVKLDGEVVLVGGRSRFEIWNAKRWAEVSAAESATYRQVAEMIGL